MIYLLFERDSHFEQRARSVLSCCLATTGRRRLTNDAAAANVSAAIPGCGFKGVSAMIFLRRLWKIRWLTISMRQPNHYVNDFWDTNAAIAASRASNQLTPQRTAGRDLRVNECTA
jgi:hypothetical protein